MAANGIRRSRDGGRPWVAEDVTVTVEDTPAAVTTGGVG